MESVPDFSSIKISTQTIIAVSNLTFDLNLLYNYLPVTDFVVLQKKRGRKKKVIVVNPNKDVPVGSIISVQNKTNIRGAIIKKKKESKTYFLNAVTVILILEAGKMINVKVSKNGKFQITGCKDDSHFLKAVEYIYKHIKNSEEQIGESICRLKNSEPHPRVVFNIVMKNIDFKIGFPIQRDKLDTFINLNTDFISHYEGSITTGVNIKIRSLHPYETRLNCLEILQDGSINTYIVDFSEYLTFLDDREKKKMMEKEKHHTFLAFSSGKLIYSGSGPDMKKVHRDFVEVLILNREHFEEKLEEN